MLTHVALPEPTDSGRWVVAYRIPGTGHHSVVLEGLPERRAREEASRLNRAGAAEDARSLALALVAPADRRIPKGFYSD